MAEIPVDVWQIVRDDAEQNVVLLRDEQGRLLPIAIGVCEAAAIWVRLTPQAALPLVRRPWSHDLLRAMLEQLEAKLTRVVIDDFARGTFFTTLHLDYGGKEVLVDARPSDSIALLLRMPAPLFVSEDVMEAEGYAPDFSDGEGDLEPPEASE